MSAGIKANVDGSAAIQVGGTDVITLTSGGAATFVTSPTTVQAGTAAAPSITFSGDTNTGIYSPGADTVGLTAGGTLVGSVGLGTTLALQGATSQSGTGITFPATQSASSNANTLDDYEEGTWTPTITAASGTYTTVTASGSYIKVGNAVTVRIRVDIGNNGTAATRMNIANFPFAAMNTLAMSGAAREDQFSGRGIVASAIGTNSITINGADATYGLGSGYGFTLCITYITS